VLLRRRKSLTTTLGIALAFLAAPALAGPLDDSHVGDTGFSGPTSSDLGAVYWNPAGLGLLQGGQAIISGSLQTTSVAIDRASIDPQTGSNPGSTAFPTAQGSATRQPFRWPLGPGSFFAVGAGIGRRFGIAVALYSPFSRKLDMSPTADGQEPARYHLVSMEMNHIALAPGLAIHASDWIQVGVAPGFLFPTARLVFDQDTSVGMPNFAREDPSAAARYSLATRGVLPPSYFLTLGALYRRGRFSLGIAYTSAPLGTGGAMTLPMDDVQIQLPSSPLFAGQSLCPGNGNCLVGQMRYRLPSIYTLGASWQASQRWSVSGLVRWLRYGSHDKVTILVSGPASEPLLGTRLPDYVVLYRGFVDSFDLRGRVLFETKRFRASATLRLETSAVPKSHVNAGAIDGTKLEPSLAAEMRIWRQIRLGVSYSFLWMLPVDTGTSVFDPTADSACAGAGGDLATPACQARMNGQARPSAAGTYHLWRQTLAVFTTIGF
jgi:long-subunit fatty acid transport protein